MKYKAFLLFLLIYGYGFSQIKIRLEIPSDYSDDYNYDYLFLNKSDSTYVKVYHSSDMGHPYARGYELKRDLPSGVYEIYINDVINSRVEIDTTKKEMMRTLFNAKGMIREIQYYVNEEFRKQDIFDEKGNFKNTVERK